MEEKSAVGSQRSAVGKWGLIALGVIALVALAAARDAAIADWAHAGGRWEVVKHWRFIGIVKFPGTFYFTVCLAVVIGWAWARRRRGDWWRGPVVLVLSAALSGVAYVVAKWCVGRTRPFKGVAPFAFSPFHNGLYGLFVAENQSFPSGHACIAFATATAMAGLVPRRYGWAFFVLAVMVGVERILENAHYPSDVVVGAVFGIIAGVLAHRIVDRYATRVLEAGRAVGQRH